MNRWKQKASLSLTTLLIVLITFSLAYASATGFQNVLVKGTLQVNGASTQKAISCTSINCTGTVTANSTATGKNFGNITTTTIHNSGATVLGTTVVIGGHTFSVHTSTVYGNSGYRLGI